MKMDKRWFVLLFPLALIMAANSAKASEAVYEVNAELKRAIDHYAKMEYEQALPIFLHYAENDNVIAHFALAKMYRFGQGHAVDYAQALWHYRAAAQAQYGIAQNDLGRMYELGLGVAADLSQAKNWYQIACANACSEGCRNLQRLNQR